MNVLATTTLSGNETVKYTEALSDELIPGTCYKTMTGAAQPVSASLPQDQFDAG